MNMRRTVLLYVNICCTILHSIVKENATNEGIQSLNLENSVEHRRIVDESGKTLSSEKIFDENLIQNAHLMNFTQSWLDNWVQQAIRRKEPFDDMSSREPKSFQNRKYNNKNTTLVRRNPFVTSNAKTAFEKVGIESKNGMN